MRAKNLARVAGCILAFGLAPGGVQADQILDNNAILAIGSGTSADALNVSYVVSDNAGVYSYDYTVTNPKTDIGTVTSFEVGFDATSDTIIPGTISSGGTMVTGNGVDWVAVLSPGKTSATLSFESLEAPIMANGNANGTAGGPWASSNPHGTKLPVPDPSVAAPEPSTITLASVSVLLVPLLDFLATACGLTLKKQEDK